MTVTSEFLLLSLPYSKYFNKIAFQFQQYCYFKEYYCYFLEKSYSTVV